MPPGEWRVWLILAGRGYGKTRAGAEWVRERVESGAARRIALVAETESEGRNVLVEGESGILAVGPPRFRPLYESSKRRLTWPNGAIATLYSGDEPDQLRGPQHDLAWADEPAKWKYATEAWNNLELGLRLGTHPRVLATTTPRPIPLLKELLRDPATIVTRGSTYENAGNLAPGFLKRIREKYEGSRVGRRELYAEMLEDVPGALWQRDNLERHRVGTAPELRRIVIGIDPATTSGEDSNETGIIVAGKCAGGDAYVLEDLSCRSSPDGWARRAVAALRRHRADRIVAETNNGGDMVERVLRTVSANVPYRGVRATKGKAVRAEPIAALYEQGRVHHVGMWGALEDQMCSFTPDRIEGSPDRVDALVWCLTELMQCGPEPNIRFFR